MRVYKKEMGLETLKPDRFYDITDNVESAVLESGILEGHLLVQVMHTTVGIYVNESEKFLFGDLVIHLNRQAPQISGRYAHDNIAERNCPDNEPENAHAHIKAVLYGNPSVNLIVSGGRLQLGKYQRILFAEFDGPCPRDGKNGKRRYLIHIIGE